MRNAPGAEDRPPLLGVDAHAEHGVDRGDAVGAGLLDRARDRDDVGRVRRELHDDRQIGLLLHGRGHLTGQIGIEAEQHPALDVGARDVQLVRDDALDAGELAHHRDVVVDAVPRDVHDHRHTELRPGLQVLLRDARGTGVLEPDRVQDPGWRLGDPVLRVARTREHRRALVHDRAEP